jgi:hypothetical protein
VTGDPRPFTLLCRVDGVPRVSCVSGGNTIPTTWDYGYDSQRPGKTELATHSRPPPPPFFAHQTPFPGNGYQEDMYFCTICSSLRRPTWEAAQAFSVETVFHRPTMGMHQPWPWIEHDRENREKNELYQLMKGYDLRPFERAAERRGQLAGGEGR